jgi:predicted sulfurtransferase
VATDPTLALTRRPVLYWSAMARTWTEVAGLLEQKSMYEPNTGCQLWTGTLRYTKNKSKYGGIYVGRKLCLTHRVAWELKHGPIPKGMCVCHVCDTPLCVNTDHLFLGTRAENNTDRHSKGRTDRCSSKRSARRCRQEPRHSCQVRNQSKDRLGH